MIIFSPMKIVPVDSPKSVRQFLEMPVKLYKNSPNYIRPIDQDIEKIFDREKNKYFRDGGNAQRWILLDNGGQTIGRVAAFHSPRFSFEAKVPVGGMGFFECINDKAAAHLLMDTCKEWLQAEGKEGMDGPINFGSRERWWGVLVDGDLPPSYSMPYNHFYYQELFESYGFQLYFKQFTYGRSCIDALDQKFYDKGAALSKDPDISFRSIKKKNLEQAAKDFLHVYNLAWAGSHKNFKKMDLVQANSMMKAMKPVLDEDICVFGYHKEEPICMYINIPDLNQIFKYLNGNLNWLGKLKFLWYKKTKPNTKMIGLVFGVIPKFQNMGTEAALITASKNFLETKALNYLTVEMNWIGDFNPKMISVVEGLEATVVKTHHTYRIFFDESVAFERHPIL